MCLFRRRKTNTEKVISSRSVIDDNVKAMNVLIELCGDKNEMSDEIRKLQEKVKYSSPSTNPKVNDYDKKIGNQIGDIKIAFISANKKENYSEVEKEIAKLKLLIAERNAE